MKAKAVVTGILALFVIVSVVYLLAKETREGPDVPDETADRADPAGSTRGEAPAGNRADQTPGDKVIVYYFHGNVRCATCRTIESYAEEAVRSSFADELASGDLEWRAVNVDEPENSHFVEDYRLVTRSLVLVKMESDSQTRWKNLGQIWQLVGSKPDFTDYVVKNTKDFMAGRNG